MVSTHTSLDNLIAELQRQNAAKLDLKAPLSQIQMVRQKGRTVGPKSSKPEDRLRVGGDGRQFAIENLFHGQLAEYLGIPKAFYDRIAGFDDLRSVTVNTIMRGISEASRDHEKRLVRTLDGSARAFLSDRYKFRDHLFMVTPTIEALDKLASKKDGEYTVQVNSLTQRRMHIELLFNNLSRTVKSPAFPKGEKVYYGVALLNSEVGLGAYDIRSFLWWQWCSNGAIAESLIRQYHVGKRDNDDEDTELQILSDKTISLEMKAMQSKVYDILMDAISSKRFDEHVEKIRESVEDEIDHPIAVVENVTKRFPVITNADSTKVLDTLIKGKNNNRYGLGNAITRLAQEVEDPDKGFELEKVGYEILSMGKREWEKLAVTN